MKKLTAVLAIVALLFPYQASGQITPPAEQTEVPVVLVEDSPLVGNIAVADELYAEWLQSQQIKKRSSQGQTTPKSSAPSSGSACSCVLYAKALTGYSQSVGPARRWPKNSGQPVVGGVVVTNESRAGHVAVITAVDGDTLTLVEANYSRCRVTVGRQINANNPMVLGFWTP